MATRTATGTGAWSTAARWDTPPVSGDAVVIPTGASITLDGVYPTTGEFAYVDLQAGGTLTIPTDANSGLTIVGPSAVGFTVAGILTTAASAEIDPAYSCQFSITPSTDGGAGIIINSNTANYVSLFGATKDHYRLLAADCGDWNARLPADPDIAPSGAVASLTVDTTPTGWLANDLVVIAPTGRLYSHWDICRLNGTPTSTTVAVSGWCSATEQTSGNPLYTNGTQTNPQWNHQGQGELTLARAEVLNLSRNIKVFSTNASLRTYVSIGASAVVSISNMELYNIGFNASNKYGISMTTTTGIATLTGLVVHNTNYRGFHWGTNQTTGISRITNCIVWNSVNSGFATGVNVLSGTGAVALNNCIGGYNTLTSTYSFNIADIGAGYSMVDCRAIGGFMYGFFISENVRGIANFMTDCIAHSNGSHGYMHNNGFFGITNPIINAVSWRNTGYGVYGGAFDIWYDSPIFFGNTASEVIAAGAASIVLLSPTIYTDTYFTVISEFYSQAYIEVRGGSLVGSVRYTCSGKVVLINSACSGWTSTQYNVQEYGYSGYCLSLRNNCTEDDHRMNFRYGNIYSTATSGHTLPGIAWQYLPSTAFTTITSPWFRPNGPGLMKVPCAADVGITIKAYVFVSSTYNGYYKPRIVALGGEIQGIATDTVGDSHTGAEAWEELSVDVVPSEAGVVRFAIEGMGTAGYYIADDISCSVT